jgi:hypothetical protein
MSKAEFSFTIPAGGDDEPDITDKQFEFIKRLAKELDVEGLDFEQVAQFGKWQASALIDHLIEIKNGVESDKVSRKPIASGSGCLVLLVPILITVTTIGIAGIL